MDDQQKQSMMIGVIAFNFTFIAMMLVLSMMGIFGRGGWSVLGTRAVTSIVAGVVVGAVAYFGAQMSQK